MFTCMAPTSAVAFAVPPAVLLALPASLSYCGGCSTSWGLLVVGNYVHPVPFTAPGIDYAFVEGYFRNIITTAYL
jgi:hypothetical protein